MENKDAQDAYEGRMKYKIEPNNEPVEFTAEEASKIASHHSLRKGLTVMPKAHVQLEKTVLNAFIFCMSRRLDARLMKKWGDAYYRIVDPMQFTKIICDELSKHIPLQICAAGKVKYVETKEIEITSNSKKVILGQVSSNALDGYFTKPKIFKDDKEFRLVFVPMPEIHVGEHFDLKCRKLLTCCEF